MSPARPVLSVLDLVPVSAGRTRADALAEMVALARTADDAGYARYWLSEHHGSTTYLASATTILMGQVLAATERIGVASGGIMLPNHAPLVIAEQIGTLATLHPGRVGLGLGRAPGTDPLTASALRRRDADPAHFANEVLETLAYLGAIPDDALSAVPGSLLPPSAVVGCESDSPAARPAASERRVRAIPGEGTDPDAWILGSSVNGARVAGRLGLPFTFASHFAPAQAEAVITTYRSYFGGPDDAGPLSHDGRPHVAAGVNVVVAPGARRPSSCSPRPWQVLRACSAAGPARWTGPPPTRGPGGTSPEDGTRTSRPPWDCPSSVHPTPSPTACADSPRAGAWKRSWWSPAFTTPPRAVGLTRCWPTPGGRGEADGLDDRHAGPRAAVRDPESVEPDWTSGRDMNGLNDSTSPTSQVVRTIRTSFCVQNVTD